MAQESHIREVRHQAYHVYWGSSSSLRIDRRRSFVQENLKLQVVGNDGPTLLGRDRLKTLTLDWPQLNLLQQAPEKWKELVEKFEVVFKEELGHIKGYKASIQLKDNAKSSFYKARNVPYALKEKVEIELDRLERDGEIEKVSTSQWAAPIVPV